MTPFFAHSLPYTAAHFGPFRVDFSSHELFKNGTKVHIQDHSFEVLAMLLERRGKMVTRDELRERLWHSDTFVDFDQGLNTAMMRLRQALGDTAQTPHFIETLPRHGYRFIAAVTFGEDHQNQKDPSPGPVLIAENRHADASTSDGKLKPALHRKARSWLRLAVVLTLAAGLVTLLALEMRTGRLTGLFPKAAPAGHLTTIAILPFDSFSNDPDQNFLAEGMTEQLITELGQVPGVRVISRGSVMQYAGKHLPLERVAAELKADIIFEGSVNSASGHLRITANLYDVVARRHLWAQTYDRDTGDGSAPQRDVARDIAQSIQAKLSRH